jgi:lysophospholipase L1-like esterase
MKKLIYILCLFFTSIGFSQLDPALFSDGIETPFIQIDTLTTTERDALTVVANKGTIIFNSTTEQYEGYNPITSSWGALGGSSDNIGNTNLVIPDEADRFLDVGSGGSEFFLRSDDLGSYWQFGNTTHALYNQNGDIRLRPGTSGSFDPISVGDVPIATNTVGGWRWGAFFAPKQTNPPAQNLSMAMLGWDSLTSGSNGASLSTTFNPIYLGAYSQDASLGFVHFDNFTTTDLGVSFGKSVGLSWMIESPDYSADPIRYSISAKGMYANSANDENFNLTTTEHFTKVRIYYLQRPDGGSFKYGFTDVPPANHTSQSMVGALSVQYVELERSESNSTGFTVSDIDGKVAFFGAWYTVTGDYKDVNVTSIANGGMKVSEQLDLDSTYRQYWFEEFKPAVVFLNGGTNDRIDTNAATMKGWLKTYIDDIQVASPNTRIVLVEPNQTSDYATTFADDYTPIRKELRDEEGVDYLDIPSLIGDYNYFNTNGLMGDSVHPNAAGYALIAHEYLSILGVNNFGNYKDILPNQYSGSVSSVKNAVALKRVSQIDVTASTETHAYTLGMINGSLDAFFDINVYLRKTGTGWAKIKNIKFRAGNTTTTGNIIGLSDIEISDIYQSIATDTTDASFNIAIVNDKLEIKYTSNEDLASIAFEGSAKLSKEVNTQSNILYYYEENGTAISHIEETVNWAISATNLPANSGGITAGKIGDTPVPITQLQFQGDDVTFSEENGVGTVSVNSSGGGTLNPNQVLVDDEDDFVGVDKEFIITDDFTLTKNLTLPIGARLVDGGGIITVGNYTINGTLISFHSSHNRTFIDIGQNGIIDNATTFSYHTVNLAWFGLVFDGNNDAGTGTDNRNVYLQAGKIINAIGGNHEIVSDGTGTGEAAYSVVNFTQSFTKPSNFYISGDVQLYLGQNVVISALPNSLDNYDVFSIWKPNGARVYGQGKIWGDERTHTYDAGNDEGCHAIIIYGDGNEASIEIAEHGRVSGDAVIVRNNPLYTSVGGLVEANFTKNFNIDNSGVAVADSNYAYSIDFDITGTPQTYGHYRIAAQGFAGYFGLDVQEFWAVYKDDAGNFIEKVGPLNTYTKIEVQPEYEKVSFVINTPSVWGDLNGSVVTLIQPERVKIASNLITESVRQGISNLSANGEITGVYFNNVGRRYVSNIQGSPAYFIDLEDGFQNLKNVDIHHNIFKNAYNGHITLIGARNTKIHNNIFLYADDSDYAGNGISTWKGERTQIYHNTLQGVTVSLGRNSQTFENHSQDVTWLLHKDGEVIKNETQNFNPKFVYSIVNVGSGLAYIENINAVYNKANASSDYLFYFRNQTDVIWKNATFDFTEAPAFDNSDNRLCSMTTNQHTTASRGSATDMTFINLEMTSHTEGLQWAVQPLKNWIMPTCGLDLRTGLTANFESENIEVAWLNLELNDYPSTNGGDSNLYNTLTFKDLKIKPADDSYLSTVRYALFAENKDVNLVFDGGYIDLQFGNVYDGQLLFNFEHYGTTTFKNFSFITDRPSTTIDLSARADGDVFTFIDCDFSSEITITLRAGDKLLYTKPHDRCPTYADNATAVAALGVGYYYKDSSNSNKFEITY